MRFLLPLSLCFFVALGACSKDDDEEETTEDGEETEESVAEEAVTVIVDTNQGKLTIELDGVNSPIAVKNFLSYVDDGFYEGTIFHRVIPGFMIQGGGYTKGPKKKKAGLKPPITNEAKNKITNARGTVAMARSNRANSATSQFFINLVDNSRLDHRGVKDREFGYAVFGTITDGMDIIDKMAEIKTHCPSSQKSGRCNRPLGGLRDVPSETILINSITRQE